MVLKQYLRWTICLLFGIGGCLYFISGRHVITKTDVPRTTNQKTIDSIPSLDEHELVMQKRKLGVQERCKTDRVRLNAIDLRHHMLINTQINMAMCFVPKTGCTFWKRVVYAIQEVAKGQTVKELFNIGKREIHSKPIRRIGYFQTFQDLIRFWQNSIKVVFARDPYSRLYSAYVDKFFLPDFWGYGEHIKRLFRKNNNLTTLHCGHDVTFQEFLRYVIHVDETGQYRHIYIDDHWQPVTRLCHPCDIGYDIVAKQETFSKDRDFILSKLGISSILPSSEAISRDDTNKDAMNQTIDTYWYVVINKNPCVTQLELAERFWKSFQIQGYIPSSLPFPAQQLPAGVENIKEPFRKLTMEMYESHKLPPESWKQQRLNAMTEAYKDIPNDLMEEIQKHFRQDFEFFSYDKRPAMLYHYR